MIQVHTISDLSLPELAPYRTMRMQREHRLQRIFVAEGEKVVRRLLESPLKVVSVLLPPNWFQELESVLEQRPDHIHVYLAEKPLLESLTGFSMYQGLLAVGQIPAPLALEDAYSMAASPRLLAAVDGLSSAENLGSLVRNCVAFRAQALVVGETCSSPYLRRAVRSSMGTVFQLPIVETSSLVKALASLRARGTRIVGAHPHTEERSLSQARFEDDCCVVFGSEGFGISDPILEACDEVVAIPMPPTVDSLNVASAAAVFLYEVSRQRTQASNKCPSEAKMSAQSATKFTTVSSAASGNTPRL